MKKEIEYFKIGQSFGGRQDWFHDMTMYFGGCAAVTACDSSIYFALENGETKLYPYDISQLSKEDYLKFSMIMKPYLRPRMQGVNTLEIYLEGLGKYFQEVGETQIKMTGFSGNNTLVDAEKAIRQQMERKLPIPYLVLRHKKNHLKDYVWHWFMIVGYEDTENEFLVKVATYGTFRWLSLSELWNTGFQQKGGMILYDIAF
ncbi:MAG: hypothetical protein WBI07_11250 [Mobilitalea sp.]